MEKTAVTVLQELMVKLGDVPDYECVGKTGLQHQATFQVRCVARGASVTGSARSKKEAKQEAARLMLFELAQRGLQVPPPYSCPASTARTATGSVGAGAGAGAGAVVAEGMEAVSAPVGAHSYVALLKELCEEYRLPAAEYELVGDTGPPHNRRFTVRASVALHQRLATAPTKKAARQIAAEQLYSYLRENLARVTKDFCEKEALVRVHEKVMERYTETRDEQQWRPDLGQCVAQYHRGLVTHIEQEAGRGAAAVPAVRSPRAAYNATWCVRADEDKRTAARKLLAGAVAAQDEEEALCAAAAALGLEATVRQLPAESGELWLAVLERAAPPLAAAANSRPAAAARALSYLRLALAVDD